MSSVITTNSVAWPSTATRPKDSVAIDHAPILVPGHDDAGGIYQGYACYRTGTTQKNDFSVATDEFGLDASQSIIYLREFDPFSIHEAYNFADSIGIENDPMMFVQCQPGMKYWLKCAALTLVEGTRYNITNGLITAIDDPTPDAVVYNAHLFTSLALATTLTGWAPFRYEGLVAIDST